MQMIQRLQLQPYRRNDAYLYNHVIVNQSFVVKCLLVFGYLVIVLAHY